MLKREVKKNSGDEMIDFCYNQQFLIRQLRRNANWSHLFRKLKLIYMTYVKG